MWQLEELTGSAELITSEIVTNAIRYGAAGGAVISLHLEASGTLVRIEVHDADPRPPVPRVPAELDESGFGFVIVEALAARWGSRRAVSGKAVWAELRIDRQQAGQP
jgi:two-component sensor histidine kinase